MKVFQLYFLLTVLIFKSGQLEAQSIFYDAFENKKDTYKRMKCPKDFSCTLYVGKDTIKFNNKPYREFSLPEEGEAFPGMLRTYFRIEKDSFYYFSDYYKKVGLNEVSLFRIDTDTTVASKIQLFYSNGFARLKIKQVRFYYDKEIDDTVHVYRIFDYHSGFSHDYFQLKSFTFSKKYLFDELEYDYDSSKIVLRRKRIVASKGQ